MTLKRRIAAAFTTSDATWARHANPWAGWARLTIRPLVALAFWSPLWIGKWGLLAIGAAFAWALLNPRMFPPPKRWDAWMTRGVLGERLWLERAATPVPAHHRHAPVILDGIATLGIGVATYGVLWASASATLTGLAIATIAKLLFIDRMVRLHQDMTKERE